MTKDIEKENEKILTEANDPVVVTSPEAVASQVNVDPATITAVAEQSLVEDEIKATATTTPATTTTTTTTPVTPANGLAGVDLAYSDDLLRKSIAKKQKDIYKELYQSEGQASNIILQENLRAALNNNTYYVQPPQNPIIGYQQGKFIGNTPIIGAPAVLTPYAAYAFKREKAIEKMYPSQAEANVLDDVERKDPGVVDYDGLTSEQAIAFVSAYEDIANSETKDITKKAHVNRYGEVNGTILNDAHYNKNMYQKEKERIDHLNSVAKFTKSQNQKNTAIGQQLASGRVLPAEDAKRREVALNTVDIDLNTPEGVNAYIKNLKQLDIVETAIPATQVTDELLGVFTKMSNPVNMLAINQSLNSDRIKGKWGSEIDNYTQELQQKSLLQTMFNSKGEFLEDRFNIMMDLLIPNLELAGKGWQSRDDEGVYRFEEDGTPILKSDIEKQIRETMKTMVVNSYAETVSATSSRESSTYVNTTILPERNVTPGAFNAQAASNDFEQFSASFGSNDANGRPRTLSQTYEFDGVRMSVYVNSDGVRYRTVDGKTVTDSGWFNNPKAANEKMFSMLKVKDPSKLALDYTNHDAYENMRNKASKKDFLPLGSVFTNSSTMIDFFERRAKAGKGDYETVVGGQVASIGVLRFGSAQKDNKVYKTDGYLTLKNNPKQRDKEDIPFPVLANGEVLVPVPTAVIENKIKDGSSTVVIQSADLTEQVEWRPVKADVISYDKRVIKITGVAGRTPVHYPSTVFNNYMKNVMSVDDPANVQNYNPEGAYNHNQYLK